MENKMRPANHEIRQITIGQEVWYHVLEDIGNSKRTVWTGQNKEEAEKFKAILHPEVMVLDKV